MPAALHQTDTLTADELAVLKTDGILHLRGVLSPDELVGLNAAWDAAASTLVNDGADTNWGPDLRHEPAFEICAEHGRPAAAVRALLGRDFIVRSIHGRSPPRGHGRQGLHLDWPVPVAPDHQMIANAFWMLDDVDGANGATRVVPGSHRLARGPSRSTAQPLARHAEERFIVAAAGDVVVFSGHLWHAGSHNESGRRRRIVLAQFSRGDLALPGSARD